MQPSGTPEDLHVGNPPLSYELFMREIIAKSKTTCNISGVKCLHSNTTKCTTLLNNIFHNIHYLNSGSHHLGSYALSHQIETGVLS